MDILRKKKNVAQHGISISGAELPIIKIFASCSNCYIYKDLLKKVPANRNTQPLPAIFKTLPQNKMNRYQYKDLTIEVLNEPTYKFSSSDNNYNYLKHYFGGGASEYPISKHGIKIYQDEQIINSCIIIGSGGATGISKNSSLLDNDKLLLCCCDSIFCLTLPDLELNWKIKADQSTCFQIFKNQEDYIIHGEIQVTKLDKNGNIKWEFGGYDIFVSIENDEDFKIENDGISLTDFSKTKYKIDFDGKLLETYNNKKNIR